MDLALSRAPVRPSPVTNKNVGSLGCAEKEEKIGVGTGTEPEKMESVIGEAKPQIETCAPICHPTEKVGKFERDLEELRLKRQSLVVRDAVAGYH